MNISFVYGGNHIRTPALSGSILPGVTRESILQLAPDLGFRVSEDRIDVREVLADLERGAITEAFAMGTGAVIAPVGGFGYEGKQYPVNDMRTGAVAQTLFDTLTAIQSGRAADPYGWTRSFSVETATPARASASA